MIVLADIQPADVNGWLLGAIGVLGGVVAVLFWQLMAAKSELITAYKEILPVSTLLMQTVQVLQKLIERTESKGGS